MWFTDALLPEFCVQCKREGNIFCRTCRATWTASPIVDAQVFSLGSYTDHVLQTLLGLWKYHAVAHARDALLAIVASTIKDYHWVFPDIDAVTFVPLHWRKLNERGFDQAQLIAEVVAKGLGLPCVAMLERTRYTEAQAQVKREDREADEFDGVFRRSFDSVEFKRLLIIDDVWTTGTTINAAAKAVLSGGVECVSAFTVARG